MAKKAHTNDHAGSFHAHWLLAMNCVDWLMDTILGKGARSDDRGQLLLVHLASMVKSSNE